MYACICVQGMQNGPMINAHAVAAMQQHLGGPRGQASHGVHPMAPRMHAPGMPLGPGPGPGVQGMPAYAYANQSTPQGAKVGKNIHFYFTLFYHI